MSVARVTLTSLYAASVLQNVFHFAKPDYVTADLAVLLTDFKNLFVDQLRNFYVNEVSVLTCHGEELQSGAGGDVADLLIGLPGAGGSDTRVPLQLAMVVQVKTGMTGRANRGRWYNYGITCNWLLNGLWNPTNLANAQGWCNTLKGRWCGTNAQHGWQLVIHGKNDAPGDYRLSTDLIARPTPGTQRRRQIGVGI